MKRTINLVLLARMFKKELIKHRDFKKERDEEIYHWLHLSEKWDRFGAILYRNFNAAF
jgi:hypothetical protein